MTLFPPIKNQDRLFKILSGITDQAQKNQVRRPVMIDLFTTGVNIKTDKVFQVNMAYLLTKPIVFIFQPNHVYPHTILQIFRMVFSAGNQMIFSSSDFHYQFMFAQYSWKTHFQSFRKEREKKDAEKIVKNNYGIVETERFLTGNKNVTFKGCLKKYGVPQKRPNLIDYAKEQNLSKLDLVEKEKAYELGVEKICQIIEVWQKQKTRKELLNG